MITKIKSIRELYEEVKDYDLVITNDAPLNTALNKELNKPRLGNFAMTSKMIGGKYSEIIFEKQQLKLPQIILKVKKELKLNLKEALYYTKNIFNIWQYLGNLTETKKYVCEIENKIIELIEKLHLNQLAMQNMDLNFLEKNKIAVIGEELFTNLDKRVLTKEYTQISCCNSHTHELETIYLFNSKKDIVDRVVSMINSENQNGVAIVLNIESEYLPLIKARLINNNIELNEKLFLYQEFRTREYLSIIEMFFSLHNIYTKELIPIGNIFNIDIDSSKENSLFMELTNVDSNAKRLTELLLSLKEKTFNELVKELEKYNLNLPFEFIEILNDLELYDQKITQTKFLELKYFIENFETEIDSKKTGVLLIDAKNSIYINRDIIFYIGMDYSWTKTIENQKYINTELELKKNLRSFEILIQQGTQRFFFVPKITNSENTIPPYYFNFLLKNNIESYNSKHFKTKDINNLVENQIFNPITNSNSIELKDKITISNSALNNFTSCPKKYSYTTLISGVEQDFFLKGTLVHAFAEFYVNNKKFVKGKEINEFVDLLMNELKLMSNPFQNKILKTQLKYALSSIVEFIDKLEIDENLNFEAFKEISKKNQENFFVKYFDLLITKPNAELEFKDLELKLNGVIDLAVNKDLIVDYKTSKEKKKVKEIVRNASIKDISSKCDFQPLVYLSIFRKINPNKEIKFWYNFPMINVYEKIVGNKLEEDIVEVNYIPIKFLEYFVSKEFYQLFTLDAPKYAENIFSLLEDFSFFKGKEITAQMLNEPQIFTQKYLEEFLLYLFERGLKDNKTNRDNVEKVLFSIFAFRLGEKYQQKKVYFFKEDLDEFEIFVKDAIEKLNKYQKNKFSYKPVDKEDTCKTCDFKQICIKQYEVEE